MEPRLFKRGNIRRVCKPTLILVASMEPRLFKRGNAGSQSRFINDRRLASMEPRLFKRGNTAKRKSKLKRGTGFNGATSFQTWKYFSRLSKSKMEIPLQWSHVFSNVEMFEPKISLPDSLIASMEPRLFKRGNFDDENLIALVYLLQWSHVFSNVEIAQL